MSIAPHQIRTFGLAWWLILSKCLNLGLSSAICLTFQFESGSPISVWRNSWKTRFLLSNEICFCSFVLDMGEFRKNFWNHWMGERHFLNTHYSVQLIPWCFVVKAVQILCDLFYLCSSPWLNCQSRKWMSITEINPDGSSTAPRNILNISLNIYSKSRQNLLLIINNHNQNIIRDLTNSLFWFCSWHETPIEHLDQVELRNKS